MASRTTATIRKAAHESPLAMLVPLGVLAVGSLIAGLPFKEMFAGHGVEEFFRAVARLRRRATTCSRTWSTSRSGSACLPTLMMAIGFVGRLAVLYPHARISGRARAPARGALQVPAQQVVLRRALRLHLRAPGEAARPPAVEGRRRLADRRLRARRRLGARARRHPQRRAAADRLPLSLCLRHADRRRRASSPGSCSRRRHH